MEQNEFRELFITNHKLICKNICDFFEVDIDTLNSMLTKSYLSLAGGYARRLYMVQNQLPLTDNDMLEYRNSDVDMFVFSIHPEEKIQPSLNDFENCFAIPSSNNSMANIYVAHQNDFKYRMYTGVKGNESQNLTFAALGNKLQNYPVKKVDRPYMFYKGSQVMNSAFGKMSLFSIREVSEMDSGIPCLQFIKTSKSKLKARASKNIDMSQSHVYSKLLLSTFDMSQTKFYIHSLSLSINDTVIKNIGANIGSQIYNCDISDEVKNNVNIWSRIKKYSYIGMKYKKEDIEKLLQPNNTKEIGSSVIEGGYY